MLCSIMKRAKINNLAARLIQSFVRYRQYIINRNTHNKKVKFKLIFKVK